MATAVHVNGAAVIKAGLPGPGLAGSLSTLGVSSDGVDINLEFHKEPVQADTGGPSIPVDYQKMGKSAKIRFSLVVYDLTNFETWILKNQAGDAEGNLPALGSLMFANGGGFRLTISSPIEGKPWRFHNCSVDDAKKKMGTKYDIWDVTIDAIAYIGANETSANTVLYDHTEA